MNGYNFSAGVRGALQQARQEAGRLHHTHVGTEHVLLGLLGIPECSAVKLLVTLRVDLSALARDVEDTVKPGTPGRAATADLPYTTGAKKVLELAMVAARELRDSSLDTTHLLLGIVREEKGVAAQVLLRTGITPVGLRVALEGAPGRGEGSTPAGPRPVAYTLVADFADGRQVTQRFAHAQDAMKHLAQWIRPS